jgi:hypothetical protein
MICGLNLWYFFKSSTWSFKSINWPSLSLKSKGVISYNEFLIKLVTAKAVIGFYGSFSIASLINNLASEFLSYKLSN